MESKKSCNHTTDVSSSMCTRNNMSNMYCLVMSAAEVSRSQVPRSARPHLDFGPRSRARSATCMVVVRGLRETSARCTPISILVDLVKCLHSTFIFRAGRCGPPFVFHRLDSVQAFFILLECRWSEWYFEFHRHTRACPAGTSPRNPLARVRRALSLSRDLGASCGAYTVRVLPRLLHLVLLSTARLTTRQSQRTLVALDGAETETTAASHHLLAVRLRTIRVKARR